MGYRERIYEGLEGKYKGLNNGFARLNKYLYGLQRRCYYLIGGQSGSGKTTLVNYMLLTAIADAESQGIPVDVFYYSYEIDEETTKSNWLSTIIYQKHKVVIPPEVIAGLGDNRLTDAQLRIVDAELPYLENLFTRINFRFEAENPTGIRNELVEHANKVGKFITEAYGTEGKRRTIGYIPDNPERYMIVIMDHMALMKHERGFNLKENIDKYSEYCIWLRNMCGFAFMNIQQFNQGLNSVDRQKFKEADLSPQQNDFKDSTNPYQDADFAIGIMNAYKMDMKQCQGYDLTLIKDNFRLVKLIKNRKGADNKSVGVWYMPVSGTFTELPVLGSVELAKMYEKLKSR